MVRIQLTVDTDQFTIQEQMKGRSMEDLGLSKAVLDEFQVVSIGNNIIHSEKPTRWNRIRQRLHRREKLQINQPDKETETRKEP